jgi:CreA protein
MPKYHLALMSIVLTFETDRFFTCIHYKSVVEGFGDSKVQSVACHLSRAQTGGVKGAMGVAEDTSDASIACRQNSISTVPIMGWPAP